MKCLYGSGILSNAMRTNTMRAYGAFFLPQSEILTQNVKREREHNKTLLDDFRTRLSRNPSNNSMFEEARRLTAPRLEMSCYIEMALYRIQKSPDLAEKKLENLMTLKEIAKQLRFTKLMSHIDDVMENTQRGNATQPVRDFSK